MMLIYIWSLDVDENFYWYMYFNRIVLDLSYIGIIVISFYDRLLWFGRCYYFLFVFIFLFLLFMIFVV